MVQPRIFRHEKSLDFGRDRGFFFVCQFYKKKSIVKLPEIRYNKKKM